MNGLAQLQAQNLAGMGRGRDSMLMHVTPSEVQGLASLAQATGRQMTANPQTGLPEAGWFEDILPMVAAAAATYFTGGAAAPALAGAGAAGAGAAGAGAAAAGSSALMTGLKAGLASGAVDYMQHGDAERALGTGLMSGGIGAMGAGLGGMGDMTQAVPAPVVDASVMPVGMQEAMLPPLPVDTFAAAPQVPTTEIMSYPGSAPVGGDIPAVDLTANPQMTQGSVYTDGFTAPPTEAPGAFQSGVDRMGQGFRNMGAGLNRISSSPEAFSEFMSLPSTRMGGLATLGGMGMKEGAMQRAEMEEEEDDIKRKGRRDYNAARDRILSNYAAVGRSAPWMAAEGGEVPLESGGFVMPAYAVRAAGGGDTEAGLAALSQKYGAQPIRGPGTGTSDSIPARIDGKTPARVSNGEAYVPRESVKQNGGSARFYQMLEAAKRQRRGS